MSQKPPILPTSQTNKPTAAGPSVAGVPPAPTFPSTQTTQSQQTASKFGSPFSKSDNLKLRLLQAEQAQNEWKGQYDRIKFQLDQANSLVKFQNAEIRALREQTVDSLRPELVSAKRNLVAVEEFLRQSDYLPFTDLLGKVDRFNDAVSSTTDYLVRKVIYRLPEIFPEELARSFDETQTLVGSHLVDLLSVESKYATVSLATPSPPFIRIILQIFIINFCVSEIEQCNWYIPDVEGFESKKPSDRTSARASSPPSMLPDFKSSFLRKLSGIFKVAAWLLPGPENRSAFERLLDPLYRAREELRMALNGTFKAAGIYVSAVDDQSHYVADYMDSVNGTDADPQSGHGVVGTVGVGLKKAIIGDAQSDVCYKNVLRAQVILEATLQKALTNDKERGGNMETAAPISQDGRAEPGEIQSQDNSWNVAEALSANAASKPAIPSSSSPASSLSTATTPAIGNPKTFQPAVSSSSSPASTSSTATPSAVKYPNTTSQPAIPSSFSSTANQSAFRPPNATSQPAIPSSSSSTATPSAFRPPNATSQLANPFPSVPFIDWLTATPSAFRPPNATSQPAIPSSSTATPSAFRPPNATPQPAIPSSSSSSSSTVTPSTIGYTTTPSDFGLMPRFGRTSAATSASGETKQP